MKLIETTYANGSPAYVFADDALFGQAPIETCGPLGEEFSRRFNSHAALVAALEACRFVLNSIGGVDVVGKAWAGQADTAIAQADAAIAAASQPTPQ